MQSHQQTYSINILNINAYLFTKVSYNVLYVLYNGDCSSITSDPGESEEPMLHYVHDL